jgi:chromosome segregation ATPase
MRDWLIAAVDGLPDGDGDGGVWGWVAGIAAVLTVIGGAAVALYSRWRAARVVSRALEAKQQAEEHAESVRQRAEARSVEAKQGQRETDYAIKKYEGFIAYVEQKYQALDGRLDTVVKAESKCREELAGVRTDNTHLTRRVGELEEEVGRLQKRIAQLEGTGP